MGDVAKGIKSFKSNMKDEGAKAESSKIEEDTTSTTTTTAAREDETAKS